MWSLKGYQIAVLAAMAIAGLTIVAMMLPA
jgi:hypothetical protein